MSAVRTNGFVSDHAVLRWLERVHGLDVAGTRAEMLRAVAGGAAGPDGMVYVGNCSVVVDNGAIVTVYPKGAKPRLKPHDREKFARRRA
jgi:hypothetical protein